MRRTKAEDHATMRTCTTETGELSYVTALNLSSYNYLGFAETDLEMRDEVPIFGLMISHRSLDLRIFVQVIASMRRYGVSSVGSRTEVIISLNFFSFRSFWKWHRKQFNICVLETKRIFEVSVSVQMGCTEVVNQLEERIAKFVGKPAAIVFGELVRIFTLWINLIKSVKL